MRDDASKLGRVPFDFDQRSAKGGLLLAFRQRLFQQPPETILFPLNPQEILNLLPRPRARDIRPQKHPTHHLISLQTARVRDRVQVRHVLIGEPHGESMFQGPHTKIINIAISLSRKNVASRARISRRR